MFFSLFCCPAIWVQSMVSWLVGWLSLFLGISFWVSILVFAGAIQKYPKTTSSTADPHLTAIVTLTGSLRIGCLQDHLFPPKDENATTRPASGRRPAVKGGEMRPVDHHPCLMARRSEFSQKMGPWGLGKGIFHDDFSGICALQLCVYMALLKQKNVFVFCINCVNTFIYTYYFELLQFVWCLFTIIYLFTYTWIVWCVFSFWDGIHNSHLHSLRDLPILDFSHAFKAFQCADGSFRRPSVGKLN